MMHSSSFDIEALSLPELADFNVFQVNHILQMIQNEKLNNVKHDAWICLLFDELNILFKSSILLKSALVKCENLHNYSRQIKTHEKKLLLVLKALQHNYILDSSVFADIINYEMTDSLISWKILLLNELKHLWPAKQNNLLPPPSMAILAYKS